MEKINSNYDISKKRHKKYNKYQTKTRYCQYHKTSKQHYFVDDDIDNIIFINSRDEYNEDLKICKMSCKTKSVKEKVITKTNNLSDDSIYKPKDKKIKVKSTKDENCPICLDPMFGKVIKKLGCSHEMCIGCFDSLQTLKEEEVFQVFSIPEMEIEFTYPSIDGDLFIKYDIPNKMVNYSIKCPMCRKSVYNNTDNILGV